MGRARRAKGRRRRWADLDPPADPGPRSPFRWPSRSSVRARQAQRAILQALPQAQQICPNPNCKHRNPTWAKYCARCGCPLYLSDLAARRQRATRKLFGSLLWLAALVVAAWLIFSRL